MPELPEVETLKRQLQTAIVGKEIAFVEIRRTKSFVGEPIRLYRRVITQVDRQAKVLIFHFETEFPKVLIHLKMTGQLIYQGIGYRGQGIEEKTELRSQKPEEKKNDEIPARRRYASSVAGGRMSKSETNSKHKIQQGEETENTRTQLTTNNLQLTSDKKPKHQQKDNPSVSSQLSAVNRVVGGHPTLDWIQELPSKHTRVIIIFTDQSQLFFNDLRVFGWLKVIEKPVELDRELQNFSKIEPLTAAFTPQWLAAYLKKSGRAIKVVLMEQSHLAGIGNIYANDALWLARINPNRPAKSLKPAEVKRLFEAINHVIALGIDSGGATESTYRQLDGLGGHYQDHFLVYKQERKPCQRCGTLIEKIKVGGRGTFICRKCQK